MTLPANVRVNVAVPFPSLVTGSGPILLSKNQGIWTVSFTIAQLSQLSTGFDPTTKLTIVYDQLTGGFTQIPLSSLIAAGLNTYRIVTAAGDVTILATDQTILMNKTVGAATNINLPTSGSRGGVPITIKDLKGDANTNNIRFVMNGTETLDGFSQASADTNGSSKIVTNYAKKTVYPLTSGGWYL
jgi:hypothetical protein